MKGILRILGLALVTTLFLVLTVNSFLLHKADPTSSDFGTFWAAARHYITGQPLYSSVRDGFHPYKYPPWTTLFTLPFALLPLEIAGVLWRLCIVASLGFILLRTARIVGTWTAIFVFISFWGFWNLNLLAGQANAIWMVIAWIGYDLLKRSSSLGLVLMTTALSGKLFQIFSLIAVPRAHWRMRSLAVVAAILAGSCVPVLWAYDSPMILNFLQTYREAAAGGGPALGGGGYGLPSFFSDLFSISRANAGARTIFFVPCALLAAWVFRVIKRTCADETEGFLATLALAAAIHPMAFAYTFVFCYPFAAMAIRRALGGRSFLQRAIAPLGLLMIVAFNEKFLGSAGVFLESHQVKAFGVFVMALGYLRCGSVAGAMPRRPRTSRISQEGKLELSTSPP
ncbi:glycosyltransferase family 87 protein [Bdellovibrionota bacterium FG-2]